MRRLFTSAAAQSSIRESRKDQGSGGVTPAGMRLGACTRKVFSRPAEPAVSMTRESATPQSAATKATTAALALPSTGGEVRRILRRSPCRPASSFLAARGCTRTRKMRSPPSQRNHGLTRSAQKQAQVGKRRGDQQAGEMQQRLYREQRQVVD